MDNQHRKIAGYRELSQEEVDLMNRIKTKGAELLELQKELAHRLDTDLEIKESNMRQLEANAVYSEDVACADIELARFNAAEPHRWAEIGKTDLQTGIMALVRAVAQPAI